MIRLVEFLSVALICWSFPQPKWAATLTVWIKDLFAKLVAKFTKKAVPATTVAAK